MRLLFKQRLFSWLDSYDTVSYTHLDVYKRQDEARHGCAFQGLLNRYFG